MDNSEYLELKKAKFYPDKIILNYQGRKIVLTAGGIQYIEYVRPTFFNFLFMESPWLFIIKLKAKMLGMDDRYTLCMSYKNFKKVQAILKVHYIVI